MTYYRHLKKRNLNPNSFIHYMKEKGIPVSWKCATWILQDMREWLSGGEFMLSDSMLGYLRKMNHI